MTLSAEQIEKNELDRLDFSSASPLDSHKKPAPATFYSEFKPKGHSIAQLNKNTGEPHEHKAEKARRLKQMSKTN